jgi:hypothetical protein
VDAANPGVIGLVDCAVLNRTEGKVTDHKKRAADDKDSADGCTALRSQAIALHKRRRSPWWESDIYDLFARRPANVHLLCRSAHPRAMTTGDLLPDTARVCRKPGARRSSNAEGQTEGLPGDGGAALRAIELKPPARRNHGQPRSVVFWVVEVSEVDPPRGEEPLHWRLLQRGAPDRGLVSHALDH